MRSRYGLLVTVVALLGLPLAGCDKFPYYFNVPDFPTVAANVEFEATAVVAALPTTLAPGTIQISGQLTPKTPSPIPSRLRLIVRRTTQGGTVLATWSYDLVVRPDGVIPDQTFPTPP